MPSSTLDAVDTATVSGNGIDALRLPWRVRPDLVISQMNVGAQTVWHIKDPVASRYFQLAEEEYFVLSAFDGKVTFGELRKSFEQHFPDTKLGWQQFKAYVASLEHSNLVIGLNDPAAIARRSGRMPRRSWAARILGLLAIRFRGVDPNRFLQRIYPRFRWIYSTWFLVVSMLLVGAAISVAVLEHARLTARAADLHAWVRPESVASFALALALAKVVHELAHALTCKHFGGECRELGVMLLVFTPCLYCDVSDAWLMKNKWHRIAISAAGISAEIWIAAAATLLWWTSEPGLLNQVCLSLMLVCSVNTLLFNGNPLMRFDGYYILVDLVDVPNLRQRAGLLLNGVVSRWLFGIEGIAGRQLPRRGRRWLLLYAVASRGYSLAIIAGLLWLLGDLLRPFGLNALARFTLIAVVVMLVLAMVRRTIQLWRQARRERQQMWPRGLAIATVLGVLAGLALLPLPYRIVAPALVEPRNAERVYVQVRGRIPRDGAGARRLQAGDRVGAGEVLVELEDPETDKQLIELRAKLNAAKARVGLLSLLRVNNPRAADQLPATEEVVNHLQRQLDELEAHKRKLRLMAPRDGVILPDERVAESPDHELVAWSGVPLDAVNAGSTLESGTTYCLIGNPNDLAATLMVDQSQIEFIRPGVSVRLWLNELPGKVLEARVEQVSPQPFTRTPSPHAGETAALAGSLPGSAELPSATRYYVRVRLTHVDHTIPLRSSGWGKIEAVPQSIAQRCVRYVAATFRLARD